MTAAKLHYYSATGKANQIRLALAAANIEFEDVTPSSNSFPPSEEQVLEWRNIGGNSTTNVPMLEMPDGKVYTQSSAVLKAVARMGNLMPSSNDDLYMTDKLIADAEDFRTKSYATIIAWGASKEEYENFINNEVPLHFGNFERQLKENGGEYFVVKDRLTIADVAVYDAVVSFGANRAPDDCLDKFPSLAQWIKRVESDPGIVSYHASDKYANLMKFGKE
uniref:GST C-terminal domain-containing protein n=1 Tax=Ditylum brightwellii TaxID=49249 RepID=A0A7S2EPT5_9STRA